MFYKWELPKSYNKPEKTSYPILKNSENKNIPKRYNNIEEVMYKLDIMGYLIRETKITQNIKKNKKVTEHIVTDQQKGMKNR